LDPIKVLIVDIYLDNKRSVFFVGGKLLVSVLFSFTEKSGVKHGSDADVGTISSAQNSPSKLGLVYHGSKNHLGRFQGLVEKLVTF
jgi:hypothetical protein